VEAVKKTFLRLSRQSNGKIIVERKDQAEATARTWGALGAAFHWIDLRWVADDLRANRSRGRVAGEWPVRV
jgi:hypothetical protein